MDTQLPPPALLFQMATGHYLAQAIYIAAKLGIADHLADGPRNHDELATATGTHADSLRRVLRLLASAGVFDETDDGRFALTPVGACMRSGPGSFRAVAQLFAGPGVWSSWGHLSHTVQTGETAWHALHGGDSFVYFETHPEEGAIFDEAMGAFTGMVAGAVSAAYDFSALHRIVDVGGGAGALLTGILHAHPTLHGTIFDLPRLAAGATQTIAAAGLTDRCAFAGGDFFAAVPEGADAYLLKHVIHDWDDGRATTILTNCRRALRADAKVLIVEAIYPPHIDRSPASRGAANNDVNMLACTGGRQRSEAEFRALFAAAGLTLTRIIPTAAMSSVIEAAPRPV